MKLSRTADGYYRLILGQKITDIESWFQPEMNRVQTFAARGGAKNQRTADVIIERWRKLVDARVECCWKRMSYITKLLKEPTLKKSLTN